MEHARRFLKGIALSALGSLLFCGAALAVPSPTYPSFDPGSDAALTNAKPASVAMAPGARILHRSSSLSSGTFQGGGSLAASAGVATRSSALKNRYLLSGMVLAALTPIALHRSGEPGDKSVVVRTQTPGSSSLPNLGDAISTGHGHGRGGNGNNGNNGNGGSGDDNEDCTGDNGDQGNGDEVCDSGDSGDNGGDTGSGGDCDNGGGGNGSPGDNGGGGNNGGGTSLPEPGTVPLLGAGLMMALAFRTRRDR